MDRSLIPSVVVGGDGGELCSRSIRNGSPRARSPPGSALESASSVGRQHGSFSAISFLQQSASDGNLAAELEGRAAPFEFNGRRSEFASAEPNQMSFLWNSFDGDGEAGGKAEHPSTPRKEPLELGGSGSFGATAPERIVPPRVVVVHVGNDDEEGCAASAGRKQRGSFSSLLLLEAHELSTLDSSPTSSKRAMQSHIEEELQELKELKGGFREGEGDGRARLATDARVSA